MTEPNPATVWANIFVEEVAKHGIHSVCIAPGSRSTPLTLAFSNHADIQVYSHLDERSAAYFALGRSKYTGLPTPVVCTSGTAGANMYPAVIEASNGNVPLLFCTADRPPELHDSGANQTINQTNLYGDHVRWFKGLSEPSLSDNKLKSFRTTVAQAISQAINPPPGPVHLNFPFPKPFEPHGHDQETDIKRHEDNTQRREEYVRVEETVSTISKARVHSIADEIIDADRGFIVCGPQDPFRSYTDQITTLSHQIGFPILADPLSNVRFSQKESSAAILGGYDSYLVPPISSELASPDIVLRFGLSPTSKTLRNYLSQVSTTQYIINPSGEWNEANFSATHLVGAHPEWLVDTLTSILDSPARTEWNALLSLEQQYRDLLAKEDRYFEGNIAKTALERLPKDAVLFVSNSMPVRDVDRFCLPHNTTLTTVGNRGASGIDGITSTALGVGSATNSDLVLLTGDLAYYHDMNGLVALDRCDVDTTIIEINNDGGGIFHKLPIEEYDPPFTSLFKTPHGLDFEATGDLYDLSFVRVSSLTQLTEQLDKALTAEGSHVIETTVDAEESHRIRERLQSTVISTLSPK
ncbi:MAG: 2-succinyl-5-enolpyruvyl-6-hydroxy-3-cyclohexene-1-carboxylic-acid synthase [Halobacteriaceae archaeon]